jgi:predicted O-methyltransferase YrrM
MSEGSVVLIDNSYWRGSFLDKDLVEKKLSAKKIKELHEFIQQSSSWSGVFIPYIDGLTLLKRTNS